MDDLVSRQAVKDWLLKWEGYIDMDTIARMQCRVIDIRPHRKNDIERLPSAQQCMTATSNTMVSDTVKIPVMDGTTERLPSARSSPCEFCKHNDISDDAACLRCTAERRTDE